MSAFTIAIAAYPVERVGDFAAWEAKAEHWVAQAAAGGAALAVFPEYAGMELTAIDPASVDDLHASIAALGDVAVAVDETHARLAAAHNLHILAPSLPLRGPDGRFRNLARLFAPNGRSGAQEKRVMTRFEREEWDIAGGDALSLFETALGPIGVAICYDIEFPLIARALAEAGATLILAPSATDSLHGYWRVRIGAQARALENQCYVAQAPVVGDAEWTPSLGTSHGAAGVFGPPDLGFPADGVVALGAMDVPGWTFATIDPAAVARVRTEGAVFNHAHWAEQLPRGTATALPPVVRVDLR